MRAFIFNCLQFVEHIFKKIILTVGMFFVNSLRIAAHHGAFELILKKF